MIKVFKWNIIEYLFKKDIEKIKYYYFEGLSKS